VRETQILPVVQNKPYILENIVTISLEQAGGNLITEESRPLTQSEMSLSCSQQPANIPYPEPD
jgi:hypothetical protein